MVFSYTFYIIFYKISMFLVIDGIDASGKKTQVDLLSRKLQDVWKTVKIIDFPRYKKESSYFVREYLTGNYGKELSAEMSSLFFAMDRFDASYDFWKDIDEYDYVIANRYVSASMIHHGCKIIDTDERKKFLDWLEDLEYRICGIPRPDMIFFLSMSFENNKKLLEKRIYEAGTTELDLHEGDSQYMQQAWQAAQDISDQYVWERINCEEEGVLLDRKIICEMILEKVL